VPIPPATVSFHGTAIVHPAGSAQVRPLLEKLASLLPPERQDAATIIEVVPEGMFVTYGVGVSLSKMREPVAACARVPVTREGARAGERASHRTGHVGPAVPGLERGDLKAMVAEVLDRWPGAGLAVGWSVMDPTSGSSGAASPTSRPRHR
jgi:hypothetical protein